MDLKTLVGSMNLHALNERIKTLIIAKALLGLLRKTLTEIF